MILNLYLLFFYLFIQFKVDICSYYSLKHLFGKNLLKMTQASVLPLNHLFHMIGHFKFPIQIIMNVLGARGKQLQDMILIYKFVTHYIVGLINFSSQFHFKQNYLIEYFILFFNYLIIFLCIIQFLYSFRYLFQNN